MNKMNRYDDDYEIECPECGIKFTIECNTCGYSLPDGWCKWNMEHHDDPCTSDKFRWKPKEKIIIPKGLRIALEESIADKIAIEETIEDYIKYEKRKLKQGNDIK